jgi:PiT family inorganic phosphate transporter
MLILTLVILFLILLFSFSNGAHDVGNIIATILSTGALSARRALALVVVCEILGALAGGTLVAHAIMSLIHVQDIAAGWGSGCVLLIVGAGVSAALAWNVITLILGLPSSSTHALCGGILGAALLATRQTSMIEWGLRGFDIFRIRGVAGIAASLFLSPLLGFCAGYLIAVLAREALKRATPRVNVFLKRAQVFAACCLALSHGANDPQKSMALIALALAMGRLAPDIQIGFWLKILCGGAMAIGTLSGGWRIVKTLGRGIFHLRPEHGFEIQFASALIILGNSALGGPVSTTHVVSSTVMGVGTAVRIKAVRWQKVNEILLAWLITLPVAAVLGGIFYLIFSPLVRTI